MIARGVTKTRQRKKSCSKSKQVRMQVSPKGTAAYVFICCIRRMNKRHAKALMSSNPDRHKGLRSLEDLTRSAVCNLCDKNIYLGNPLPIKSMVHNFSILSTTKIASLIYIS